MKIKQLAIFIPATLILIILAFIPFHALLTVWASSLVGHYTPLRLWKEYLVVIALIGALYIFLTDKSIRQLFYYSRLIQFIIFYLLIELVWGLIFHKQGHVNTKALFYGWLSDCRYLVFFLITLIIAKKTSLLKNHALKVVFWPAVVVILFGLAEVFILPKNFLSHFGYGPSTIPPFETINNNSSLIRIASTLRGSNPLGAYLIIPLSLAAVLLAKGRRRVWQLAAFIAAGLVVMVYSFSRSAWIGLVVSLAIAAYFAIKSPSIRRYLVYMSVGLVIILGAVFITERNNPHVQNIVFHYQKHSTSPTSSDQSHTSSFRSGLKQVLTEPLGKGPGTAGPASVYNNHPARIAENYYIQIGQEIGWLGLAVFLVINVLMVLSLWLRRKDALSLALLASFVGLIVCNLLLEAWTDDSLAYLWWGLAGIALASQPNLMAKSKRSNWLL